MQCNVIKVLRLKDDIYIVSIQAILPRIERTREIYSIEPEVFTRSGRRVLKRPKIDRASSGRIIEPDALASLHRSTSGDAERLGSTSSLFGTSSASERFLSESQRRLRNILNDSATKPTASTLKPIIHTNATTAAAGPVAGVDDAARFLGRMSLLDYSSSSAAAAAAEKKAVYFNDTVEYRSPPVTVNDD